MLDTTLGRVHCYLEKGCSVQDQERHRRFKLAEMDTSILKHFYWAMVKYQILEQSRLLLFLENSAFVTSYVLFGKPF